MSRATVRDIAKMVDMHPNTIRNWTDAGIIECTRDFRGWRWFPNPDETIRKVKALLYGQPKTGSTVEQATHK